jgi:hypothetical protein
LLLADDFHRACEWQIFVQHMRTVFPDRPIVDIPDNDPIFTHYSISTTLCHIPGAAHLRGGYRVPDYPQGPDEGKGADWRAIYDDNASRLPPLTISIFGDSWE